MKQDSKRLGKAVRERREALGLSQREASEQARKFDLECWPKLAGKSPGLSTTLWAQIEQGDDAKRRGHTLELVDAVLRWPPGTAMAKATGQPEPDGSPVTLPSESNGHATNEAASRVELARSREEVASLRTEVAELHARIEGFDETLKRLLRIVEGR